MPEKIPHRELRNNSSAVLRRVRAGETLEVTNHGEVVAVLSPAGSERPQPSLATRKARTRGGFSALPRARLIEPSQPILDDLRAER